MDCNLSLLKYCIPCKAKCCKTGKLIGSPILSEDEAAKIREVSNEKIKEITSPSGGKYYVFAGGEAKGNCPFLSNEKREKCKIQNEKPLDCLCYPVKAVYVNGSIKFIIDTDCPAAKHLTPKFIENAKVAALKSIKRFDRPTYKHWLDNYVGWVKTGHKIS